jgi:hypothetical protein
MTRLLQAAHRHLQLLSVCPFYQPHHLGLSKVVSTRQCKDHINQYGSQGHELRHHRLLGVRGRAGLSLFKQNFTRPLSQRFAFQIRQRLEAGKVSLGDADANAFCAVVTAVNHQIKLVLQAELEAPKFRNIATGSKIAYEIAACATG